MRSETVRWVLCWGLWWIAAVVLVLVSVLVIGGCGEAGPPMLLAPPPTLLAASFDDGAAVSPTATLVLDFSAPLDPGTVHEGSLLLVRGAVDDEQRRAWERGAPSTAERERLAPLRISHAGARVVLAPARPLVGASRYTLVITTSLRAGGRRLASTVERGLRTRAANEGAPWFELVTPDAGASGVVRNLREASVRFNRPVTGVDEGSLRLLDDAGEAIAARVLPVDGSARSFRLLPRAPLRALRRYHVEATGAVRDDDGEAPFELDPAPGFTVGLELREQPVAIDAVTLEASSGCVVARFTTGRPSSARLCLAGDCVEQPEPRMIHLLEHPVPRGAASTLTLAARDESTAPEATVGPLGVPPSSDRTLRITEVLAHPHGGGLAGQFVEVQNVGDVAVSTAGVELRDERGASALPVEWLAPGAVALIVPAGFAPEPGQDVVPPPSTLLLRVAASHLGGNGLRQSGEALELRDPEGLVISRFSTVGLTLAVGQSARRVAACDRDGAWEPTPGGAATPGAP